MQENRLTFYYAPNTCSLAPHVALEEAGVPYEAVLVDFSTTQQRSPDYLKINPKGRVPVLDDDGFILTENPAIMRAIARKRPAAKLWPEDPFAEARCSEWIAWCASTVQPAFAHIRRTERYATSAAAVADVQAKGRETCRELWTDIDRRLGGAQWAAGEAYSVADPYLLVFWLWGRGPVLGYDMAAFPAWTAHARRVAARPAVRRILALERNNPPE